MADIQLQSMSFKVLVDKEKNRVVFAESDKNFVNVLFRFLTMPIGTIIRLTRSQPYAVEIGSKPIEGFSVLQIGLDRCFQLQPQPTEAKAGRLRLSRSFDSSNWKSCEVFGLI
ncbi:hypothetical protein HHK36_018905 [Tetracentron sinense]|uniref:Uncharacterized protein n=1 Tax=Tetracentron sinense TaxID=13715 RepID=A0A835D9I5_TETSI|nr:hypothetical protein HHK36_018905 [Tetracentron sinense]